MSLSFSLSTLTQTQTHLISSRGQVEHLPALWLDAVRMSFGRAEMESLALDPQTELGGLAPGRFSAPADDDGTSVLVLVALGRGRGCCCGVCGLEECDDSGVLPRRDGLGLGRVPVGAHDPRRVLIEHDLPGRGHRQSHGSTRCQA